MNILNSVLVLYKKELADANELKLLYQAQLEQEQQKVQQLEEQQQKVQQLEEQQQRIQQLEAQLRERDEQIKELRQQIPKVVQE